MSSEDDNRIECKYGAKCYQKNAVHIEKYKHPSKRNRSPENTLSLKKFKLDIEDKSIDNTADNPANREKASKEIDATTIQGSTSLTSSAISDNKKQFIKNKFFVDMPDDFYLFWEFCKKLCKQNPKEAFKSVGLILVGPYDVLDETFKVTPDNNNEKYALHWRYYYDPPEFQTILKGDDKSGYHMGYFRDSPDKLPAFVGSNKANENCIIQQEGENIFGAVNTCLDNMLRIADPFKKMTITSLQRSIITKAKELNINLNKSTVRHRKTVCKTFHSAGIVVPYDRQTEIGYRKLPVDEKELRKILDKVALVFPHKQSAAFAPLQHVLTAATIANDECDFGTALELGIDIFCYGNDCFNNTVSHLLKTVYALLNRHAFANIIDLHLSNRKKGVPFVIDFS